MGLKNGVYRIKLPQGNDYMTAMGVNHPIMLLPGEGYSNKQQKVG